MESDYHWITPAEKHAGRGISCKYFRQYIHRTIDKSLCRSPTKQPTHYLFLAITLIFLCLFNHLHKTSTNIFLWHTCTITYNENINSDDTIQPFASSKGGPAVIINTSHLSTSTFPLLPEWHNVTIRGRHLQTIVTEKTDCSECFRAKKSELLKLYDKINSKKSWG